MQIIVTISNLCLNIERLHQPEPASGLGKLYMYRIPAAARFSLLILLLFVHLPTWAERQQRDSVQQVWWNKQLVNKSNTVNTTSD